MKYRLKLDITKGIIEILMKASGQVALRMQDATGAAHRSTPERKEEQRTFKGLEARDAHGGRQVSMLKMVAAWSYTLGSLFFVGRCQELMRQKCTVAAATCVTKGAEAASLTHHWGTGMTTATCQLQGAQAIWP